MLVTVQGHIAEPMLGTYVSPVLAAFLRRHFRADAHREVLAFCRTKPEWRQLKILTRLAGHDADLLEDIWELSVGFQEGARLERPQHDVVVVQMLLNSHRAYWRGNRMSLGVEIPVTLAASLKGRRLADLVDHHLLPADIAITNVEVFTGRTEIALAMPPEAWPGIDTESGDAPC